MSRRRMSPAVCIWVTPSSKPSGYHDPLSAHAGQKHPVAGRSDHAGIATQMVVERKIAAEEVKPVTTTAAKLSLTKSGNGNGIRRHHYPSDAPSRQLRRLERERFTMDEGLSNAVKEVFVVCIKKT